MSKKFFKHYIIAATVLALCVVISLVYLASFYLLQYKKRPLVIAPVSSTNHGTPVDTWQILGDPMLRHQVYSAFFDNRPEIIAFTIACPLINSNPNQYFELPQYVVLSYDSDPLTSKNPVFVPIRYSYQVLKGMDPSRKLAVCVGPVYNYKQARRIVEFVRITQLMGVEKIYFYYLNSTLAVKKVLDYFHQEGSAQVFEWNLRGYEFRKDVRAIGNFIVFNECVYRATFYDDFKYVAIFDLDELLVSFEYPNLVEFIERLDNGKFDSFLFRAVFFHEIDEKKSFWSPPDVKNKFLYTQARTIRTSRPFPSRNKTKYVMKARNAIEVGNHFLWRSLHNSELTLHPQKGLVFHYRDQCFNITCNARKRKETTMSRYGPDLWKLVDSTCADIFNDGVCPIIE